jgi:protoporphyrin/coproporphyrin ferrochelatase
MRPPYDALIVVSFGGPEGPDDVMPFLRNVTRGRDVPDERLAVVAEQYMTTGGRSPINDQNRALVDALRVELASNGLDLPVYWGNRNWAPYLADTVATMRDDGVERALAFVTSAYSSYSACRQYLDDIETARATVGDGAPRIDKIRQFWNHPGFVEPFRDGVARAVDALTTGADPLDPADLRLVATAHSLPMSMAATSDYEAQLRDALALVAEAAPGIPTDLVWQSRSGPPQVPWLEPDVNDHLRDLRADGVEGVVIAPIGFVSDHQEVVYDLDVMARATAEALGLRLERVPTPGTDPRFVAMVRSLVTERLDGSEPLALGEMGVRRAPCVAGCCPAPSGPRPTTSAKMADGA